MATPSAAISSSEINSSVPSDETNTAHLASSGTISKVKDYHEKNFEHVSSALEHIGKQLRKVIRKGDEPDEITFTRLYTMLLGVWCEARLHKLLYEKGAFSEHERANIYNAGSLEIRWQRALDIGLKKNASLAIDAEITISSVGFVRFKIYEEIHSWISDHFSPAITLRNKVAHGQWVSPFTNMQDTWIDSSSFKICSKSITALKKENLQTTSYKIDLLKEISITINNLAVDSNIYQVENFDDRYKKIFNIVEKINTADYSDFKSRIRDSLKTTS